MGGRSAGQPATRVASATVAEVVLAVAAEAAAVVEVVLAVAEEVTRTVVEVARNDDRGMGVELAEGQLVSRRPERLHRRGGGYVTAAATPPMPRGKHHSPRRAAAATQPLPRGRHRHHQH